MQREIDPVLGEFDILEAANEADMRLLVLALVGFVLQLAKRLDDNPEHDRKQNVLDADEGGQVKDLLVEEPVRVLGVVVVHHHVAQALGLPDP